MAVVRAEFSDFETVKSITEQTIKAVYPHYYPDGAVEFFLEHHSDENIKSDIEKGRVYLYLEDNAAVGTVTVKENELCRLFVLPEYQGKGYGSKLLSFAENKISENHSAVVLAASLPAKSVYLRRGYSETGYYSIKTENGDYLCYDMMAKSVQKGENGDENCACRD
ncbi:MAG: GNAT family N-acetyltransferase [Ruminococcus sp.]|nr:GNAT family N-acetyltransferase [Ruminococcus sp.]